MRSAMLQVNEYDDDDDDGDDDDDDDCSGGLLIKLSKVAVWSALVDRPSQHPCTWRVYFNCTIFYFCL